MNRWLPRLAELPAALALGAACAAAWLPFATRAGVVAGVAGALCGSIAGNRLAATRLRALAVAAVAAAVLATGLAGDHLLRLFASPVGPPEFTARLGEGVALGLSSFAMALAVRFAARRWPLFRPLPAALLVLAVAALLAQHRGGSIHLPYPISDQAWLRGWHPAVVLSSIGVAAGLAAGLGLLRTRARGVVLGVILLALAAGVLARYAPGFGLLTPPKEDPLGLTGDDTSRGAPQPARSGGTSRGHEDPLGLSIPRGASGNADQEMAPFRDEYTSDGAQAPVAVVILHDDVEPQGGVFYFRQVAFSTWNGRRLVRSFDARVDRDVFPRSASSAVIELPPAPATGRQEVPATVSLIRDHVLAPVLADGQRLAPAENADPALFQRTYDTVSRVLTAAQEAMLGHAAGDPSWPDEVRETYLALPPDPRYRVLAEQSLELVRPEYRHDAYARALAVAYWLERNTHYSLRSHHASAEDPTASFLFGDRIGYCVHLSHAAAFLMRALGLPSRVAAGYAYAAADRAGGSALLLRAGDAHAWAEVYLDGVGWVPVDPAPPSLDPPAPAPNLDLQRLLGEMSRPRRDQRAGEAPEPWRSPSPAAIGLLLAGAFAAWAGAGHAAKAWRRLAPRLARADRAGRAAYRAALDRLGEAGWHRRPGETREAFAERARAVAPSVAPLTRLHLAAHFGRGAVDPQRARNMARNVAAELQRRGGWRRWLGMLDPWSWRSSR
ncbi:MAG: transglutaminase domain-containing protein [Acidobacteria bacterium]|nr:transglutaminase domain-containing protein [Acidobacteriota bacterium]